MAELKMIQPCRLTTPITIQTDSQSAKAKALAEGSGSTGGLRHVAVQYNFLRDPYEVGLVEFEWIRSEDQLADPFTKNFEPHMFTKWVSQVLRRRIRPCYKHTTSQVNAYQGEKSVPVI